MGQVRECHLTEKYIEAVTIRRPVVFAVSVILATLIFVAAVMWVLLWELFPPIPFD